MSGHANFGQFLAELLTAVKHGRITTHILLYRDELGQISRKRRAANWPIWQTGLHGANVAEDAALCGAIGFRAETTAELEETTAAGPAHDAPILLEAISDPERT